MVGYWNGSNANTITSDGALHRLITQLNYNNYNRGIISPSLKCKYKNDAFTKEDNATTKGNGKLLHKVGLITEDETALAGGRFWMRDGSSNNDYKSSDIGYYWAFSSYNRRIMSLLMFYYGWHRCNSG